MKRATSATVLCALSLGLAVLPVCAAPAQGQAPVEKPSGAPSQPGAPVTLDGETIYVVKTGFGAFTAKDRADAAERRIQRIAEDPFYDPGLLTITPSGASAEIRYGDFILGVITPQDARASGAAAEDAAGEFVQTIKAAVARYRERRAPAARLRSAIELLAATLLLVIGLIGARHIRLKKQPVAAKGVVSAGALESGTEPPVGRARLPALWEPGLRLLRNIVRIVLVVAVLAGDVQPVPADEIVRQVGAGLFARSAPNALARFRPSCAGLRVHRCRRGAVEVLAARAQVAARARRGG